MGVGWGPRRGTAFVAAVESGPTAEAATAEAAEAAAESRTVGRTVVESVGAAEELTAALDSPASVEAAMGAEVEPLVAAEAAMA